MAQSTITVAHYTLRFQDERADLTRPTPHCRLPYAQGRVEERGERDGHPEVEEAVPKDGDRGLGPDPEHGEGGEHGGLEHADASRRQWERSGRSSYAVGDEQFARASRHP